MASVAQVFPLAQRFPTHNAMGEHLRQLCPRLLQSWSESFWPDQPPNREEGEVEDEELDEYEKALVALLGDNKITGLKISEKIVKQKRDSYWGRENIKIWKFQEPNPKASVDYENFDRGLQTQSWRVGGRS